jgi:hypothetical protein
VATAGVDLPRLRLAHPPKLDLPVVTARNDEGEGRVESRPVHSTVVTFEDVLDDSVGVAEEVGLAGVRSLHLLFEGKGSGGSRLLAEACRDLLVSTLAREEYARGGKRTRDVPHSHGLIHRSRHDVVLLRVKLSAPASGGYRQYVRPDQAALFLSRDICMSRRKRSRRSERTHMM